MTATIENIKSLHETLISDLTKSVFPDGTYNLNPLEAVEFTDGYQVSFCNVGDEYSADDYMFVTSMFAEISTDGVAYAGKFDGTAEVSYHIKNKLTAIKYAKMFNQISIWDWKNSKEIPTGGTGKR